MNLDEYSKEQLWKMLVDAVRGSFMYASHKAYVRDSILPSQPDVSALELAERLSIPIAEGIVILEELDEAKKAQATQPK